MIIIFYIMLIIGLFATGKKSIKALRAGDSKEAMKWGLFSVGIVLLWLAIAFILRLLDKSVGVTTTSMKNNDYKEGDYVRVIFKSPSLVKMTGLIEEAAGATTYDFTDSQISGFYKQIPSHLPNSDKGFNIQVIGFNGVSKGNIFYIPNDIVKSIRKESIPREG